MEVGQDVETCPTWPQRRHLMVGCRFDADLLVLEVLVDASSSGLDNGSLFSFCCCFLGDEL